MSAKMQQPNRIKELNNGGKVVWGGDSKNNTFTNFHQKLEQNFFINWKYEVRCEFLNYIINKNPHWLKTTFRKKD